MTPDELAAIRARDGTGTHILGVADRRTLLAEVNRLTADTAVIRMDAFMGERARILAAVEAEYAKWPKGYTDDDGEWCLPHAAIIAAIEGEMP
jgi:hypothetical protein